MRKHHMEGLQASAAALKPRYSLPRHIHALVHAPSDRPFSSPQPPQSPGKSPSRLDMLKKQMQPPFSKALSKGDMQAPILVQGDSQLAVRPVSDATMSSMI
jgi:hypothetical protein